MRHFFPLIALSCLTIMLSGCGSSPEGLMKRQISLVNELAEAMENDASEDKIKSISEKLQDNVKKMQDLDVSADEGARLAKEYAAELMEAYSRLGKATRGRMMRKGFPMPSMPNLPKFPG